jgi:mannose-P-dolichol utilization defect 1
VEEREAWGAVRAVARPPNARRREHSRSCAAPRRARRDPLSLSLTILSFSPSLPPFSQGYCVLAGSCIRSVPQIVKIVRARSVTGLSLAANAAELVAYSITFAYNYRLGYGFSTYGELVSCWAQDLVLVTLLLHYGPGLKKRALLGVAAYGGLLWAFMSGAVPMPALTALQASTIFIVALGGRLPQILLNAKRGNSGQLSILTSGLNLAGNVARVFTTLVLTGDGLNLVGAVVQGCLNSVLLTQCWRTIRAGGGATAGGVGGAGGGGELPGLAGA